jgi:hypothetical protein
MTHLQALHWGLYALQQPTAPAPTWSEHTTIVGSELLSSCLRTALHFSLVTASVSVDGSACRIAFSSTSGAT